MAGPAKARRDLGSGRSDVRTPPHSIEAEQAVLGGLHARSQPPGTTSRTWSSPEDFYRPDHRLIFEAIARARRRSQALRRRHGVGAAASACGKLDDAGGLAYLGTLARDTPTAANVRAYAEIVRERSLLRQLISAGSEIAASVFNDGRRDGARAGRPGRAAVFEIAEARRSAASDGAVAVRTLLPALIDQIDDWHNNPDKLRGLPTGFTDFDKITGGLRGGDLVIVAGRPSMGKTTLAVNMAEYAALKPRHSRLGRDLQHGNARRAGDHAHALVHRRRAARQHPQRPDFRRRLAAHHQRHRASSRRRRSSSTRRRR